MNRKPADSDTILETDRLILRYLRPTDTPFFVDLWTDAEVTRYMGGPRDRRRLEEIADEDASGSTRDEYDLWIAESRASREPVGHCGLLLKKVEEREEVEVVYVIARPFRGRGFATEIAGALAEYAFAEKQVESVVALIRPDNLASGKVARAIGMRLEKELLREERRIDLYRLDRPR